MKSKGRGMNYDCNGRERIKCDERARHAVNFDTHDEHIPKDVRGFMKDLCIWTSDGMDGWIGTICRTLKCLSVICTLFGSSKMQQFARCYRTS